MDRAKGFNRISTPLRRQMPFLLLVLVILLSSVYMVCRVAQKEGLHIDEMFTLMDVNGSRPYLQDGYHNTWHLASELESAISLAPEDAFSRSFASRNIYWNLMHIAYSLQPGEFSIWPGIAVNIAAFAGSLVILYLLSLLFIDNKYLALLPGICWSLSGAAINIVAYIRLYAFMVFICLLFTYLVLIAMKKGFKNWGYLISLVLITYIGTFVHQYFYIYAFFLTVFLCLCLLVTKQFLPLAKFSAAVITAIAVNQIVTDFSVFRLLTSPPDLSGLHRGETPVSRGTEAVVNLIHGNDGFLEKIALYLNVLSNSVFSGINLPIILAVSIILSFIVFSFYSAEPKSLSSTETVFKGAAAKLKILLCNRKAQMWLIINGVCISYLLLIARIAPYLDLRYIVCITPLVVLSFVSLVIHALKAAGFKQTVSTFAVASILCGGLISSNLADYYFYKGTGKEYDKLSAYNHLPAVCISEVTWDPASCYWFLFEFEEQVLFAVGDDIDLDVINELSFDDGLILLLSHSRQKNSDIALIQDAIGLDRHEYVANFERYAVYYLY